MIFRKTLFRWLVFLLLSAVALFSILHLVRYYRDGQENQARYGALAEQVHAVAKEPATFPTEALLAPSTAPSDSDEPEILPEYLPLFSLNPHMVGWLEIPGTDVNYPVVQSSEDPEYYLYRDFDGTDNLRGCLFADAACNIASAHNVTVYGHNMKDGSMFAQLFLYESRAFWEAHPTLRFDALTRHRTYRIFAVFRTTASAGEGFAYHKFTDAASSHEFDAFIANCKALSLYDTGIIPQQGDQILCLSTCEYSRENGRFVVAAVLEK